jgi:hypothetical protein
MAALAAVLLWAREWRTLIGVTLLLGVLLAGLVLTFSQSSLAALLVACLVLAALRWRARPARRAWSCWARWWRSRSRA